MSTIVEACGHRGSSSATRDSLRIDLDDAQRLWQLKLNLSIFTRRLFAELEHMYVCKYMCTANCHTNNVQTKNL